MFSLLGPVTPSGQLCEQVWEIRQLLLALCDLGHNCFEHVSIMLI